MEVPRFGHGVDVARMAVELVGARPGRLRAPDLVGAHIGINVFGSDGIPRVVYDDFELTAVGQGVPALPPTGLAILALLVLVGGALVISRRGAMNARH